jgi:hypothetical protein
MANCPHCGSSDITLKRETNVSWGRAIAGWALFGVVGGAVGAVTGDDRNVNACLECGTTWKAADLYHVMQTIKAKTGVVLNLAFEEDRRYMNDFLTVCNPHIENLNNASKQSKLIINKVSEQDPTVFFGCIAPMFIFMILAFSGVIFNNFWLSMAFIIAPMLIAGVIHPFTRKQQAIREREANQQANQIIINAQDKLRFAIAVFQRNNPR